MENFVSFSAEHAAAEALKINLAAIKGGLAARQEATYCTYFLTEADYREFHPLRFTDFMENAFQHIKVSRSLVCLVLDPHFGTGTLMELGCAKGHDVPIVMVSDETVGDYELEALGDYAIRFTCEQDIRDGMAALPTQLSTKQPRLSDNPARAAASETVWRQFITS